jgi:hypothetical protein
MLVCWLLHETIPKSRDIQFCVNQNAGVPGDEFMLLVSNVERLPKLFLQ